MSEPWDLRSNIKAKPGSQGTLFRAADKGLLNPEQRWPRGYTPERLGAVREALSDTDIAGFSHEDPVRLSPPQRDAKGRERYAKYPQTEARVTSALARSTVPPEHLHGLTRIHDQPHPLHLATYFPNTRELAVVINRPGREGEEHLIHELGHHVSAQSQLGKYVATEIGTDQAYRDFGESARITHPPESSIRNHIQRLHAGVEEAVADSYALEHFRPHGRINPTHQPQIEGLYERLHTSAWLDEHFPGYSAVRPRQQHLGPQFNSWQGELFHA